jgi:hypothetical protein
MGWRQTLLKYGLQFAEMVVAEKLGQPAPVVPFPTPPSAPPPVAPPPPAPAPEPIPQSDFRDQFVFSTYRLAKPEGMNRFPDDTEWRSDSENVQKYGREWLRKNMYERNGVPYPGPTV